MALFVSHAYLVGPDPSVLPGKYLPETVQLWKEFIKLESDGLVLKSVVAYDTTPFFKLCAAWRLQMVIITVTEGQPVGLTFRPE